MTAAATAKSVRNRMNNTLSLSMPNTGTTSRNFISTFFSLHSAKVLYIASKHPKFYSSTHIFSLAFSHNMPSSSEISMTSPSHHEAPKNKGGRKAVRTPHFCPLILKPQTDKKKWQQFTAEARRQRNRDAQAAFRERRTEYIKELEAKVDDYTQKLRSMEGESRINADDRLMLRYKNSLLERILLHKGRDGRWVLLFEPGME